MEPVASLPEMVVADDRPRVEPEMAEMGPEIAEFHPNPLDSLELPRRSGPEPVSHPRRCSRRCRDPMVYCLHREGANHSRETAENISHFMSFQGENVVGTVSFRFIVKTSE